MSGVVIISIILNIVLLIIYLKYQWPFIKRYTLRQFKTDKIQKELELEVKVRKMVLDYLKELQK